MTISKVSGTKLYPASLIKIPIANANYYLKPIVLVEKGTITQTPVPHILHSRTTSNTLPFAPHQQLTSSTE
jgi:hypothetical protein